MGSEKQTEIIDKSRKFSSSSEKLSSMLEDSSSVENGVDKGKSGLSGECRITLLEPELETFLLE